LCVSSSSKERQQGGIEGGMGQIDTAGGVGIFICYAIAYGITGGLIAR